MLPFVSDGILELSIQLRWGDMDINHHVNNVQIARLFEEGRVRSFRSWLDARPEGFSMLVARQDIVFTAVLNYSVEPVTVLSSVKRIGTSSFVMALRIVDPAGTTCAIAETTMVSVDASGRPVPLPTDIRPVLESHHRPETGIPARD